jgi:hypothetical protein
VIDRNAAERSEVLAEEEETRNFFFEVGKPLVPGSAPGLTQSRSAAPAANHSRQQPQQDEQCNDTAEMHRWCAAGRIGAERVRRAMCSYNAKAKICIGLTAASINCS